MSGNQGTADAMMQAQLEAEVIDYYNMLCNNLQPYKTTYFAIINSKTWLI